VSGAGVGLDRPVPERALRRTTAPPPDPTEELRASLRRLLATLLERGFGIALDAVERIASGLDDIAARGGLQVHAVLGGMAAKMEGASPVLGALRAVMAALSPAARAALILALVLALLLLPVTAVLVLLALIVLAVVLALRARRG
jgi:hypothetical protein